MADARLDLQGFQFDVSAEGCKQVVALCRRGSGGRLFQTGVLFQGFVINLDAPPFLIEFRLVVK